MFQIRKVNLQYKLKDLEYAQVIEIEDPDKETVQ